jgi:hypothetical protein
MNANKNQTNINSSQEAEFFYLKYNLQLVWDCCMDAAER